MPYIYIIYIICLSHSFFMLRYLYFILVSPSNRKCESLATVLDLGYETICCMSYSILIRNIQNYWRDIVKYRCMLRVNAFDPIHGVKLTLINTTYVICISVSLGFPYMVSIFLSFPYMVMLPKRLHVKVIVLGTALLWAALSQVPLMWRHNDMAVIVSRNTRKP